MQGYFCCLFYMVRRYFGSIHIQMEEVLISQKTLAHGTCHIKQELVSHVNLYIKFFLCNTFCIYTMFKFSKYFCALVFNPTFTGKNATSVLELAEITPVFKIGLHLRNLGDFH